MNSITMTVDIETLKETATLQYIQNTINRFTKVLLYVDVMKRGVKPVRISFTHGEYTDHAILKQDEAIDTVFDLLGLPVQLLEGYRKIKVNTSYREHLALPASREYVDVTLSERSLPVYILRPVTSPVANARRVDPNNSTESTNELVLVGHTSGELTAGTDLLHMWVKPNGSVPYIGWGNKKGNVWLFMSHEFVEVTGILLT